MDRAGTAEGFSMDPVLAYTSARPVRRTDVLSNRGLGSSPFALETSATNPGLSATPAPYRGSDATAEQQRMLHLISHVDAECFISLLQMLDPKPDDYRARAEYKRRYEELREALEVPPPPVDPQPRPPTE
jgi:hypothetical protein